MNLANSSTLLPLEKRPAHIFRVDRRSNHGWTPTVKMLDLNGHLVYGKVSVVPLDSIAAPRSHDVQALKHDGRDDIQTP